MTKYKVGDVAALFSKPKDPTTAAGKKLQSLFEDFYSKNSKSAFHAQEGSLELNKNEKNKEMHDQSVSKKNKKRKFSSLNDPELNSENVPFKKLKKIPEPETESKRIVNKKHNKFIKQGDLRKRKKKFEANLTSTNDAFPIFDTHKNDMKSPTASELKSVPKEEKQNKSFIKKSKKTFFDSFTNSRKLSYEVPCTDSLDDDASLIKEMKEIVNKSEKRKGKNDNLEQKSKFNLKNQSIAEKSTKKPYLNTIDNSPKKYNKEPEEQFKNNEIKKSNYLKQQDFPRTKKRSKVNSFYFNNSFTESEADAHFENEGEMSTKSKKMKKVGDINAPKYKSKQLSDAFVENPSLLNSHKLKYSPKGKTDFDVSKKFKNSIAQDSSFSTDEDAIDTFKNKTFDSWGNMLNSEKKDNVTHDRKFKKNKLNFSSQVQTSEVNESYQNASDFIKLSSTKEKSDERLSRTLFVGNLPINTKKRELKKLFSRFGEVEMIRITGIETDKAKIFSKNTSKSLSTKYASDSIPGFIVFQEREKAVEALRLSGCVYKDHHITVDFAVPAGTHKFYDEKRSIFIGNLPFDVKDESIWSAFMQCGRIECVRVVRDRETGIGKGFGYVLFSTVQAKENALSLNNVEINGREVRIKPVDLNKRTQKVDKSSFSRNTFKSRAIRLRKNKKTSNSRKSIKKITNQQKALHKKKKISCILQKKY